MSRQRATGHIDANVPDYQKILLPPYNSKGWSSTQSSYNVRSSLGKSSHGNSATYQPSKYSLTADSLYSTGLESRRSPPPDDRVYRSDNGNLDGKYGYYRKPDYSSDTGRGQGRGHGYSSDAGGQGHSHGYSSDVGHGNGGRARRMADYSSDSGHSINQSSSYRTGYSSDSGNARALVYGSASSRGLDLRPRRKSSEFELEIPSPGRPMSVKEDTERYTSPAQIPMSDYYRYMNNHSPLSTENQNRQEISLADYLRETRDREQDNNDSKNTETDIEDVSFSQNNDTSEVEKPANDVDEAEERRRLNFMSPPLYRGSLDNLTMEQRDTKPSKGRMDNLTQWQQYQTSHSPPQHHITESHSYTTPHRRSPDSYHRHTKENHNHVPKLPHHTLSRPRSPTSGYKTNDFQTAADSIIREKDDIIQELTNHIMSLEVTVKENENKYRRALMTRHNGAEESVSFNKMQDLEFRNSELRAELAKLKLTKETEIEDLEIKLGGVEHEVVQLKTALRKSQPNTAAMKDKVEEREKEIEEWQTKYSRLNQSYEDMTEKMEGLERYLSGLPTIEEFNKMSAELSKCKEECRLKTEQIGDLEKRLQEITEQLSDRDITLQESRGRQQQLASKLHEANTELKRIKTEGEGKALSHAQDELADTKEMKDRLAVDLEKAKKLLEMHHRRLRQLKAQHQSEKQQIQERLVQEEESGNAHREELRMKEEQISKLKRSIKEFANKNQDLMDEGLILKQQLKECEQSSSGDALRLQGKFVREMKTCFGELQSLVQVCIQRSEGKEPDISLLLGMKTLDDDDDGVGGAMGEDNSLKYSFKKLKELQAEVERMRKDVCNKCAEEMGDKLTCATQ